jgi:four helix bundle protein
MSSSIIQNRTFQFALEIILISAELRKSRDYDLSRQLFKSGTSIGANVEEALGGASRKDFKAKLIIARKEAREANYWLRLIQASSIYTIDVKKQLQESYEIIRILTSIIKTTQANP